MCTIPKKKKSKSITHGLKGNKEEKVNRKNYIEIPSTYRILKSLNGWQPVGETSTLTQCLGECRMTQLLWSGIW